MDINIKQSIKFHPQCLTTHKFKFSVTLTPEIMRTSTAYTIRWVSKGIQNNKNNKKQAFTEGDSNKPSRIV